MMREKGTVDFEKASLKLKISSLDLNLELLRNEKDKMIESAKKSH